MADFDEIPAMGDPFAQPAAPGPEMRIHTIMPEQEAVLGGSEPSQEIGVRPFSMLGGGGRPAEPSAPIRAYHGSPRTDLTVAAADPPVRQFDNGTSALGAFLSPNRAGAERYAGPAGRVYPADVNLSKPYEMPVKDFLYLQDPTKDAAGNALPGEQWGRRLDELKAEGAQLRQQLQAAGHDGVLIRDTKGNIKEIASFNDVNLGGGGRPATEEPALSPFEEAAMARSAAHEHERISTRLPSEANAPADIHSRNDVNVDYQTALNSPRALETNAQIIRDYGGHQIPDDLSAADTVEAYTQHLTDNILAIHDRMDPDIVDEGKLWYAGANASAHDFATRSGVEPRQSAAVIAAQSPRKDWFMNRELGKRVLDIHANQQDTVMTPQMHDFANGYIAKLKPGSASLADAQEFMANAAPLPFGQMTDPVDRAHFIRFFDEAHNPDKGYDIVSPRGVVTGRALNNDGSESRLVWGGMNSIAKAASVLQDGSLENISRQMGDAHKVRNFYNNIIAPYAPHGDVTVDTHAIAAANLFPYASGDLMVEQGLGGRGAQDAITGHHGLYPYYFEAYRRAGDQRQLMPREMQSVVWEGAKGLFPQELKAGKAYREGIEAPWVDYENGTRTLPETQAEAIRAAGGIQRPSWAGSRPAAAGEARPAANPRELPRSELPWESPGDVRSGGGTRTSGGTPGSIGLEPAPGDPFSGIP